MASGASNDFLVAKARCADLELQNAHLKEEANQLRQKNAALEEQLRSTTDKFSTQATGHFREELYTAKKEVARLTDHKTALEQQLEKANETIANLHKNITREVQKAKEDVERQSIFLRSQILEQKEINTSLQEKLMTALNVSKQLEDQGMHDNVTETILITSDAVLQKFRQEHKNNIKGKYDVSVDINGRNMVLSGRRVNVQLLKAEVMTALNEAYCALVDPSKYVSAAKAKEEASRHEIEHLRRTVITHESTIQSLHVALQHAQDRSNAAVAEAEDATRRRAVAETQMSELQKKSRATNDDYQRQIQALKQSLQDGEETNRMALASLKSESQVSAQYRLEMDQLRDEIRRLTEVKELADRSVYVTTQQLEMTRQQLQESVRYDIHAADLTRRLEDAESRAMSADQRVAATRREAKDHAEKLVIEIGTQQERLRRAIDELAQAKKEAQSASLERDAARVELQQSRETIYDLRNRLGRTFDNAPQDGMGNLSDAALLAGSERHTARLEEENSALRTELQQAFEDMRAVATSLKETRAVRERAMDDIQRLESDKAKLYEERQKMERQIVEERMSSRQRESELELQIIALRDEINHQKKRVDMLHAEYQKKISEHVSEVSQLQQALQQSEELAATPGEEYYKIPKMTPQSRTPGRRMPSESQPHDASQLPQRTPKHTATTQSALKAATPSNSSGGVFTLRSASNDANNSSGLVGTPRQSQPAFRLSAAKPSQEGLYQSLESPPR